MIELNPVSTEKTPNKDRHVWWATLFALCAVLGAMLGLSVKTQTVKQQIEKTALASGTEALVKASADDQRTIAELQKQLAKVNATPSDSGRVKLLAKQLVQAQFLAGLTDVKGPGVIVTLNDSKTPLPAGMPAGILGATPPNIIHDTDIGQVVNELKAAGAEAISVNDQRLVAVSPVRCAGPTIFVNNTPQTPPYTIKAIGDPRTLSTALSISGGIADQIQHFDPAMFKVVKSPKPLIIAAYSGGIEPKYAVPVAPAKTDAKTDSDKNSGV